MEFRSREHTRSQRGGSRSRWSIIGLLLPTLFLASSCGSDAPPLASPESPRDLTPQEKSLVESGNGFGIHLFRAVSASAPDSNVFISPLSVSLALGMALNGASGQTYEEMKNTLALQGLTEEQINQASHDLIELLCSLDPDVTMEIANSIWIRQGFPILPEFLDLNRTYFGSSAQFLDFARPDAVGLINAWIAEKTHDRITKALDSISARAMLYLIQAVYFKALWAEQFDEAATRDAFFTDAAGRLWPCRMMRREADLPYFENSDFQAVDLPYGNGRYSMTILLPKGNRTVDELIAQITPERWAEWMGSLQEQQLSIGLPRFRMEYATELKDVLVSMGMPSAFSDTDADFTRIYRDGGIYISRVVHKTFVEVDEKGTEAAAVTIIEFEITSAPVTSMVMDRPFIFVLRERESGTLLFMGKMARIPSA